MAIYEIFEGKKGEEEELTQGELFDSVEGMSEEEPSLRDKILSTVFARLFFLFLLLADLVWGAYIIAMFSLTTCLRVLTANRNSKIAQLQARYYLSLKRFVICGISLIVALCSPALGVMFACTYFLMYDKAGIEEIVPGILRAQFKEFFTPSM